jgi:hypothetical protein
MMIFVISHFSIYLIFSNGNTIICEKFNRPEKGKFRVLKLCPGGAAFCALEN